MIGSTPTGAFEKLLRYLIAGFAAAFIVLYVAIAWMRMGYPYEFEWMEGGQVDHVLRILHGQKIYVQPSSEFTAFAYNPLFYYAAAGLSWVLGPGFVPLRLLSFLASVGALAMLYRFVQRETGSPLAGLVSAGLFAATYPLSGGWFDVGRVDSLFLVLMLAGFYVIRFHQTNRGAALSGALFFLSFLAKQWVVVPAAIVTVFLLLEDRRRSVIFAAMSIGLSGLAVLLLNAIHNGWYLFIVSSSSHLPVDPPMIPGFWIHDLAPRLLLAMLIGAFVLIRLHREKEPFFRFYACMTFIMLVLAWSGRIHNGGFINVLMPFHLQLAFLCGLCFLPMPGEEGWLRGLVLPAILLVQFCLLIYDPARFIPTEQDRQAGDQMIRKLHDIAGDVMIPYHGYYATLAGKKTNAHIMTMIELVVSGETESTGRLVDEFRRKIRQQSYGAIVLDREWFRADVEKYYVKAGRVFENENVFWPVAGVRTRPEWIYVPRKQ